MLHGDILGERARLSPDETALVDVATGERLSYAELDRRAAGCARTWLEALGARPGDRVAILSHNRPEYVEAFFAAGKSGVALVTLGTRLTPAEMADILTDAEPVAVLYDEAAADAVAELRQRVDVAHWVALDEPRGPGDLPYARERDSRVADRWRGPRVDPESNHCLLYTSGTTGQPKGVRISHRQVTWNGYNTMAGWGLTADDVSPIFTPLYHAGGLMAFLTPIFVAGGTVVLHRAFDVEEVWETIEREGCTVVLGVPTIWKMLMESPRFETVDLSHVKAFFSGGAPLPRYLIDAYQRRDVVFKQGFGMTEVGVNCFAMSNEESVRKAGTIGRPMMFTEVRLVDGDGRDVGDDEVGEMWFRGPHVCNGYWRNPEATAAALDDDGWFHSGDLARRDSEGFFTIAGRSKEMIISGGVNVFPAEVEGALLLHPGVEDAALVGVPDDRWGEKGIAFVVDRGAGASDDELAKFLAERLARYKIPKLFVRVGELPRTAYGKVVKGDLRRLWDERSGDSGEGAE